MEVLEVRTWTKEFGSEEIILEKLEEYLKFVRDSAERYRPEEYSEWHHVLPRCLDKDGRYSEQGVRIRGRDHLTAHMMLVDCFSKTNVRCRLSSAVAFMTGHSKVEVTPEEFERMRQMRSDYSRGDNNPAKSPEVRRKMSENHANFSGPNHPMYGVSRYGESNPFYGKLILKTLEGRFQRLVRDLVFRRE